MTEHETNDEKIEVTVVREALATLALANSTVEQHQMGYVRHKNLLQAGSANQKKPYPCDAGRLLTDHCEHNLMKLMEFVQTFLVANRVSGDIPSKSLLSPPINLRPYVEELLKIINPGDGAQLSYFPWPHLKMTDVESRFVDVAGFVVVLLTDFVRSEGGNLEIPVVKDSLEQANRAMEFLVASDTWIADDEGRIAWAFVPGIECGASETQPVESHRHIFPTARAIVAIQRYLATEWTDDALRAQAQKLLPEVLRWLDVPMQSGKEGLYFQFLADHIYATEALLALYELESDGAEKVAIQNRAMDAVDRLLIALADRTRLFELDDPIVYRVTLKDYDTRIPYDSRATYATCMSTLCQAMDVFPGDRDVKREEIRSICDYLRLDLISGRNAAGLWPEKFLLFHCTLGAVEALLRYSTYARVQELETSVESVEKAAIGLLDDPVFRGMFRSMLVDRIARSGRGV